MGMDKIVLTIPITHWPDCYWS